MREAFAERNIKFICKYNNYSEKEIIKMRYGLQVLYTIITKTGGILLLSLLLNAFKEALVLMLLYGTLRIFGHGIHTNKSSECWFISIICYAICPLLIKFYTFDFKYVLLSFVISFIGFILWAPADTPKKPLIRKNRRIFFKIATCIISLILLFISYKNYSQFLTNCIFFAYLMELIAVCPLTYKLLKISFNNYKTFK